MPEFKNFYLTILNGHETPVGSVTELKNFINHLFRTDKAQKWTNESTPKDWAVMPAVDRNDVFYLGDLNDRRQLYKILVQTIKALVLENPDDHLFDYDILGFLYTFKVVWTDDNDEIVDQPFGVDELSDLVQKFYNTKESVLLTLACHQDEGNQHLHGLFIWIPGDINRMSKILSSADQTIEGSSLDELQNKIGTSFEIDDSVLDNDNNENKDNDLDSETLQKKRAAEKYSSKINWSVENTNTDSDEKDNDENIDIDESEEDEE